MTDIDFVNRDEFKQCVDDIKGIISHGRLSAYSAVNSASVITYWSIGKRIVEEECGGKVRADYGKRLISILADELSHEFGENYSSRNLHNYKKFYLYFPNVEIVNACVHNLTWTHFRSLLRVDDETARVWYLNEASKENWSSRILDRNISTQYYYRLLKAPDKNIVISEMVNKSEDLAIKATEVIKSPFIAEFLGLKKQNTYLESDIENSILSHLSDFLLDVKFTKSANTNFITTLFCLF